MNEKKPQDQFQIGETVLYRPEGVLTRIRGYLWSETVGDAPRIVAYELDCNITVDGALLERMKRREAGKDSA